MRTCRFSAGEKMICDLLQVEGFSIQDQWSHQLFAFLSGACHYEEEGRKIKPKIILSRNLISSQCLNTLVNVYYLPIKQTLVQEIQLEKDLKSLLPFCNNAWHVYIDFSDDTVRYGIVRAFNGPIGLSITDLLLEATRSQQADCGLICIDIINRYELIFTGVVQHLRIDFRLSHAKQSPLDAIIRQTVHDLVRDIVNEDAKVLLTNVFAKIFTRSASHVHGTICAIVEAGNPYPIGILADGTWLPEPIDITEIALELLGNQTDIYMDEKFYGLVDVILEMFNVDGITVIDTKGCLLAYNCFVKAPASKLNDGGGARKRAAMALLESRTPELVGVYFQSQDGQVFYEKVSAAE